MSLKQLYFKHDFGARNNPKLKKIKRKYGIEGIGIYWCLLEILYENEGKINEEELENICWDEKIDFEKTKVIMNILEFVKDENNDYCFESVNERIKEREEYCNKQRENANKRWNKEKKVAPVPDFYPDYEKEFNKKKQVKIESLKNIREQAENLFK